MSPSDIKRASNLLDNIAYFENSLAKLKTPPEQYTSYHLTLQYYIGSETAEALYNFGIAYCKTEIAKLGVVL